MVAAADLAGAAAALGRPHEVRGTVVRGDGRGRELGYPTANVAVPAALALPPAGVYAVRAGPRRAAPGPRGGQPGTRPTFAGEEETLEVHLLEPPGRPVRRRPCGWHSWPACVTERRFAGPARLAAQIAADIAVARVLFG